MSTTDTRTGTSDAFDRSHAGRMHNPTVDGIYRIAFGKDYPETAQPNAFYSRTTLERLANALKVGPGRTLVDLGCGHGGPSLWVAQRTAANLIGIDLSPVGVDLARRQAAELGFSERARFEVGDLTATGLPGASCDAAMSLDVVPFLPDKAAGFREVRRILQPGGRFAFTTWEQIEDSAFSPHPFVHDPFVADYRGLLEGAGFTTETYEEPPQWRTQQQALAEGIVAAEANVSQAMGAHYPAMARSFLANLPKVRYLLVVARRPPATSNCSL